MKIKIIMIFGIAITLIVFFLLNNETNLVELINSKLIDLKKFNTENPVLTGLYFSFLYIMLTSLSLPVAFLLGITSGIIFEPYKAILLVSFSSSIGATLALTVSRYIFRDYFKKKFSSQYNILNNGFVKNGVYYLFAIRMSPIFPYFLVNLVSGLTTMKILPYYLVTQIGMLPNTILVILLGNSLDMIILSDANIGTDIILILTSIGVLPILFKQIFKKFLKT
jgi:uncharacterized membrane protein YdjX (TVP38/TMEM64 family)